MGVLNLDDLTKPNDDLYQIVQKLIVDKYKSTERNLQVALGPSEIGAPCDRQLAYNSMHHYEVNDGDPLPSVVGTAAHTWMHDACLEANERAQQLIWIPESVVNVEAGLNGHSDAYHMPTRTVFDWKFPGTAGMKTYRTSQDPGEQYRVQGHCYGKGFKNKGLPVDRIAIAFLPRGGNLFGKYGAYIWAEAFDESVADVALARYHRITELGIALNVHEHPERYQVFAKTTGYHCSYCDWHRPTGIDTGDTCPGIVEQQAIIDLPIPPGVRY